MAAAFFSYLGTYHHNFRRMMLTVHWPNCLRERGVPLVIDSIDGLKGNLTDLIHIQSNLPKKSPLCNKTLSIKGSLIFLNNEQCI